MFLKKPRRFKTILAFLIGLSVSLVLLAGGLYWYQWQQSAMREQISVETRLKVESDWMADHPVEVVYAFTADMKAGRVLNEQDLALMEIGSGTMPLDVVRTPEDAIGRVMRNDVKAGTLCMQSLIYQPGDYPDDARIQEYTAVRLPQRLEKGQTVDVRVMFPNGLDFVVLSKKNVLDLQRDETGIGNLVWLTVSEQELLRMSSAVVDAFLHPGTVLYAVTYVAPDVQGAAAVTYPANAYVQDLILSNPNIVASAVNALERENRKWFDAIPDPQPQQPMAIVPAPSTGAETVAAETRAGTAAKGTGTTSGAITTSGTITSDGAAAAIEPETTKSTGTAGGNRTTGTGEGL